MEKIEVGKQIIDALNSHNHEAYLVGGCVRDLIMGKEPNDVDITTSAVPDEVLRIFPNAIPTGIQYGTVTLVVNNEKYEITTFRKDIDYADGRRPTFVEFGTSLKSDLLRRDFTINAIAMDKHNQIRDYYGGVQDIKTQTIKCVGSPNERFKEDALRMLRAIRFAYRLNFSIEPYTYDSILNNGQLVKNISAERYTEEFMKIVSHGGIKALVRTGLCAEWLPELHHMIDYNQNNRYHKYNLLDHTYHSVAYALENKFSPEATTALVFHDIGKPSTCSLGDDGYHHYYGHAKVGAVMFETIQQRLKLPTEFSKRVKGLIHYHDYVFKADVKMLRKACFKHGLDFVSDLIDV